MLEVSKKMPSQYVSHEEVRHIWLPKINRELEVNFDTLEAAFLFGNSLARVFFN